MGVVPDTARGDDGSQGRGIGVGDMAGWIKKLWLPQSEKDPKDVADEICDITESSKEERLEVVSKPAPKIRFDVDGNVAAPTAGDLERLVRDRNMAAAKHGRRVRIDLAFTGGSNMYVSRTRHE